MAQALELARRGIGRAHPNPVVGAVLVKHGRAIGTGFHVYDRRDHAEIVALEQAGGEARGATLYVNLEPCCRTGRTGPCTKAVIAARVKRVVAAMRDPNPEVSGQGFAELRRAGVQVTTGVDEREALGLNEGFARWILNGLPFVTLKAALTLDGQIAMRAGRATPITGRASLSEVQRMRHGADALLTGIGTVLSDDPRLTDRTGLPRRQKLLRAVVDSRLRLPLRSKLVESAEGDVVVFTSQSTHSVRAQVLEHAGIEVFGVRGRGGRVDLREVIRELGRRQVLNVLIEAGGRLNGAALLAGIVDKMVLFYAPRIMGTGGVPLAQIAAGRLRAAPSLSNLRWRGFGPDFAVEGYLRDVHRNYRTRRKN